MPTGNGGDKDGAAIAGSETGGIGLIVSDITDTGPAAFIDPATIGTETSPGSDGPGGNTGKRGRGRPRKNGGTTQTQAQTSVKSGRAPISEDGLTAIMMAIHLGIATLVKQPELELEEQEARKLSAAAVGVAKHYNIEASEKALAWTNLAVVGFSTYGPRVFAMRMRWETEKKEREDAERAKVGANLTGHLRQAS
jgi:hypothetical protein